MQYGILACGLNAEAQQELDDQNKAIKEASKVIAQLEGITPRAGMLLLMLSKHYGTYSELALICQTGGSGVSRIALKLEELGFVSITESTGGNKRQSNSVVTITEAGRRVLEKEEVKEALSKKVSNSFKAKKYSNSYQDLRNPPSLGKHYLTSGEV